MHFHESSLIPLAVVPSLPKLPLLCLLSKGVLSETRSSFVKGSFFTLWVWRILSSSSKMTLTVNYFVLSGKRIDQNLSVCLAGLRRLHLLLFRLPPLLVLDVPQPLLLHKALLHLVMLEVFLSQLCELSGGREGVQAKQRATQYYWMCSLFALISILRSCPVKRRFWIRGEVVGWSEAWNKHIKLTNEIPYCHIEMSGNFVVVALTFLLWYEPAGKRLRF